MGLSRELGRQSELDEGFSDSQLWGLLMLYSFRYLC